MLDGNSLAGLRARCRATKGSAWQNRQEHFVRGDSDLRVAHLSFPLEAFALPLRSGMPYRVDATRFLGDILKFLGSFRARARLGPAFHETAQHDRTHKAGYPCLLPRPSLRGNAKGDI